MIKIVGGDFDETCAAHWQHNPSGCHALLECLGDHIFIQNINNEKINCGMCPLEGRSVANGVLPATVTAHHTHTSLAPHYPRTQPQPLSHPTQSHLSRRSSRTVDIDGPCCLAAAFQLQLSVFTQSVIRQISEQFTRVIVP